MVALHTAILVGSVVEVLVLHRPFVIALGLPALALFLLANALRFWVIATLGVHWNVRVVRSMPLGVVTSGPYRFVRHPNYLAVFVELLALPLVHSAVITAIVGAALHALILHRRVALEESVLMTDDAYRRAFVDKPRFVPWPMP
jgi:methyltransferase